MANQHDYNEIWGINCFSVSNGLLRVKTVNGLCPWREGVNMTVTQRSGAEGRIFCCHQAFLQVFHSRQKCNKIASGMSLAWRMAPDWRLVFGPLWCVEEQELPVPILLIHVNRGGWRGGEVTHWFCSSMNVGCSPSSWLWSVQGW